MLVGRLQGLRWLCPWQQRRRAVTSHMTPPEHSPELNECSRGPCALLHPARCLGSCQCPRNKCSCMFSAGIKHCTGQPLCDKCALPYVCWAVPTLWCSSQGLVLPNRPCATCSLHGQHRRQACPGLPLPSDWALPRMCRGPHSDASLWRPGAAATGCVWRLRTGGLASAAMNLIWAASA